MLQNLLHRPRALAALIVAALVGGVLLVTLSGPNSLFSAPFTPATTPVPGPPPTGFPYPSSWTFHQLPSPVIRNNNLDVSNSQNDDGLRIALVAVLKREHNYIADWVKYHLALGFDRIYLYDNEDKPAYAQLLRREGLCCCVSEVPFDEPIPETYRMGPSTETRIIVKHMPIRKVKKRDGSPQLAVLANFHRFHFNIDNLTHVAHFDIDEYLQLNNLEKYKNVRDLVKYTLTDAHGEIHWSCGALAIQWVLFGDSGLDKFAPEPVPVRFTCSADSSNAHVKSIVRADAGAEMWVHNPFYKMPPRINATTGKRSGFRTCLLNNGSLVDKHFYRNFSIQDAQINHYQRKTLEEALHSRVRGRASVLHHQRNSSDVRKLFAVRNNNDIIELRARNYFLKNVYNWSDEEIENHPQFPGVKCGKYTATGTTEAPAGRVNENIY